jgi:UDP-N-acetylglucosamine--N-acetylmuramyl-(pentapeptide) pyrophosphoryl-undecaprenol N-acetylglucosamine transferase
MIGKRVIITSGGSGGHIIPAVVFGKKLDKEGIGVLFMGDAKLSRFIKDDKNLPCKNIKCGSSLTKLRSIKDIILGFLKSLYIIYKFKPDAIIGFGCYATLPVLMASVILRKNIFLHEQNSHIGKINKLFSSKAKYIFTSFYEIYGVNIKNSSKIEFTGNLVRDDIKELYKIKYQYPAKDEFFNILIVGGSGGASFFAEKFINIFKYFSPILKKKLNITQQVKAESEIEAIKQFYEQHLIKCEVDTFFMNISEKLRGSHLVISRSGIGIASELAIAGKPTVFVPSPNVTNNHQFFNADFYKKNDACLMFEEKDFDERNTAKIVLDLIEDKGRLKNLSNNIRKFAYLDADEKIYNFIREDLV